MDGPAGSSGSGTGSRANVYTPQAQPQADTAYQGIVQNLFPYANNPASTPGGVAYLQAQPYLSGIQDPSAIGRAQYNALTGSDYYTNQIFPNSSGAGQQFFGSGMNLFNQSQANPYSGIAQGAALTAGDYANATGQAGLTAAQNVNQAGSGLITAVNPITQQMRDAGNVLGNAGSAILQTGYDPQQALYNQLRQQTLNTANVGNAFSGVGYTPYGQSVVNQAASNFDMNWENQQLARQAQAVQAADANQGTISDILQKSLATAALGLQTGAGLYGTGLNLGSGASSLMAASGTLPANQYANNISQLTGLQGGAQNLVGGGLNTETQAAQGLGAFGQLPFNTNSAIASNVLQALGSGANLGNNQFLLPQQVLQDLQSYLGLGQSASTISGQLGNLGLQQLGGAASGLGQLVGGANSLFGNNGLLTGGGGLGGLFGGTTATGAAGDALAASGLASDFSGGVGLDTIASTGGGGGILSSLLPFSISA